MGLVLLRGEQVEEHRKGAEQPEDLVHARLITDATDRDRLVLVVGGHRWPLPEPLLARRPMLRGYTERDVVVGLRPAHLTAVEGTTDPAIPRLRCRAATVESLGTERNLLFTPPGPAPEAAGDDEARHRPPRDPGRSRGAGPGGAERPTTW